MSVISHGRKRAWGILIYVLFLVSVLVSAFSYVSYQTFSNLSVLQSIKRTFSLYSDVLGAYEETLVAYFDDPVFRDPGDRLKGEYLGRRWDSSISRYKPFIHDFVDPEGGYSFNLTEFDGEFGTNAKTLRFVDVFWNDPAKQSLTCDLSVSFLRWSLWPLDELTNRKLVLPVSYRNLVSAAYQGPSSVLVRFSTGFVASPALSSGNFAFSAFSGITVSSLTKQTETDYLLGLSAPVPAAYLECTRDCLWIWVQSGTVRDSGGQYLPKEVVPVHSSISPYANRYRLEDSWNPLLPNLRNYSLVFSSGLPCFFGIEWTDGLGRVVDVPSSWVEAKVESYDARASGVSRSLESDTLELWPSLFLSNYLYKLR